MDESTVTLRRQQVAQERVAVMMTGTMMLTLDALARELGCSLADLFDLGVVDAEKTRAAISGAHPVSELLVPTPLADELRAAWLRTQVLAGGDRR